MLLSAYKFLRILLRVSNKGTGNRNSVRKSQGRRSVFNRGLGVLTIY